MEARGGPAGPSRTPPADEWRADYFRAIPELDELSQRTSRKRDVIVMRASQLDASRLDTELTVMLEEQFMKAFALVQPVDSYLRTSAALELATFAKPNTAVLQRIVNALKPELALILDFLIFRFSVWRGQPTPGSRLMNLRYRDETASTAFGGRIGSKTGAEGPALSTWQRVSWGLAWVLGRYAWVRLESIAAAYYWVDSPRDSYGFRAWQLMHWSDTAYRLASLLNFLVFLRYGKYRSLVERLIRARLVYHRVSMPRALSFEYLNRQLVWHELSELLLFLLPLVNIERVKNLMLSTLPSMYRAPPQRVGGEASLAAALPSCQLCQKEEMPVPYVALPCEHNFCYYCLRSRTQAEPGFKCPTCGSTISAMRRWRPDPS